MTKNSPATSTGCHISLIGHITRDELRRQMTETEYANGFANRFLWICVRRSKLLPHGSRLDEADLEPLRRRLEFAVRFAREQCDEAQLDAAARELWADIYGELSDGKLGLLGTVTSRAEAQVMRLAMIYALLDCRDEIGVEHLNAALAVWRYAEQSARYIFGSSMGDPVADRILRELRAAGDAGLGRDEIRNLFGRNVAAEEIGRALAMLAECGLARFEKQATGGPGRPEERWFVM